MYECHQKINALNEALSAQSLENEKYKAKIACKFQELCIGFENLKESIDKTFKQLADRMGQIESLCLNSLSRLRSLEQVCSHNFITKETFDESISSIENSVISNHLKQALKNDNFSSYIDQLREQTAQSLKDLKEELSPRPNEFDPIKSHVEERFQVWKVDFDGLVRELAIVKKSLSYDQKKFENIYTLIERLKGEK
jgi:chromosome segregation ATPase